MNERTTERANQQFVENILNLDILVETPLTDVLSTWPMKYLAPEYVFSEILGPHGQKTSKIYQNCPKIFPKSENFRKRPNASRRTQTHPIASERIRTSPNVSEQVQKRPKTSKSSRKLRETWRKLRERGANFSNVALCDLPRFVVAS